MNEQQKEIMLDLLLNVMECLFIFVFGSHVPIFLQHIIGEANRCERRIQFVTHHRQETIFEFAQFAFFFECQLNPFALNNFHFDPFAMGGVLNNAGVDVATIQFKPLNRKINGEG